MEPLEQVSLEALEPSEQIPRLQKLMVPNPRGPMFVFSQNEKEKPRTTQRALILHAHYQYHSLKFQNSLGLNNVHAFKAELMPEKVLNFNLYTNNVIKSKFKYLKKKF